MNAVIYARYSPGPRQTDQSIEGQVRDCMAYAEQNDIKVLKVYADRHISGTDFEKRAEFNKMLRDSEKGQFEAIIVWKIDRFGRDREEIALNKIKLKRHGIKLLYAKEVIPDGPEGIILESLMEGLAEYYVADLRQKVKRGQRESALKGLAVSGMAAYGYKISDEKRYVENEDESWVVKYVFEHYAAGKTATEILDELSRMGVKNRKGSPITKNGIYSMIRNEKYIGKCTYDGIDIPIPALISEELWDAVQSKIIRRPHSSAVYKAPERYLLSLKAFCGECGAMLVGESGYGKQGNKYLYYKCSTRKKKGHSHDCSLKTIRKEQLEDFVVQHTISDVLQDDVIDYIADKVIEINKKHTVNQLLSQLKSALRKAENGRNNLLKAIEDGIYTPSTKERLLELENECEELKVQIAKESIKKPEITKDHVVYWLEMFRKGNIKDDGFKQRLLDVFVHSVYVYNEKVVIAYNYTDNNHDNSIDVPGILEGSDTFVKVRDGVLYPNLSILNEYNIFVLIVNSPAA